MRIQVEADKPRPATPQSQEEILLAQEVRKELDNILDGSDSRNFDLSGRKSSTVDPSSSMIELFGQDGEALFGSREASLFYSKEWPIPTWTPTSANISRIVNTYSIDIRGYLDPIRFINHGLSFVLYGTYPQINLLKPGELLEVKVPVLTGCFRPRINRLRYGQFLISRIVAASGTQSLALQGLALEPRRF